MAYPKIKSTLPAKQLPIINLKFYEIRDKEFFRKIQMGTKNGGYVKI